MSPVQWKVGLAHEGAGSSAVPGQVRFELDFGEWMSSAAKPGMRDSAARVAPCTNWEAFKGILLTNLPHYVQNLESLVLQKCNGKTLWESSLSQS